MNLPKIRESLRRNRLLWQGTALFCAISGLMFAIFKETSWEAAQAVVIRDEAIGKSPMGEIGQFGSEHALKRSLETVLQIAKNHEVVSQALKLAATAKQQKKKGFPTDKDVAKMQGKISVDAPKGSEFGATEVVYVSVQGETPERAMELNRAVCDQLERRMQRLRNQSSQSIVAELSQKVRLAEDQLQNSTLELAKLEGELGSDLGEMRTLSQPGAGGDSSLRVQLNTIKTELRQIEANYQSQMELHKLLATARGDYEQLMNIPNRLLVAQPALQQLKNGLVDAKLRAARLRGSMTDDHPFVQASRLNQQAIVDELKIELQTAILALETDMKVNRRMVDERLHDQSDVTERLEKLASLRALYVNVESEVAQRQAKLLEARNSLAEAQARQEAARTASLLTRLDGPITGTAPVGPSRKTIVLGSSLGGLALGLSLVYLVTPFQEARARGRRAADRNPNARRRAADQQQAPIASTRTEGRRGERRETATDRAVADDSRDRSGRRPSVPASRMEFLSLADTVVRMNSQTGQ